MNQDKNKTQRNKQKQNRNRRKTEKQNKNRTKTEQKQNKTTHSGLSESSHSQPITSSLSTSNTSCVSSMKSPQFLNHNDYLASLKVHDAYLSSAAAMMTGASNSVSDQTRARHSSAHQPLLDNEERAVRPPDPERGFSL
jgi:hypothetical protein